jgi:hypothetical protein
MSKTHRFKHVVKGLSPECVDHEWSGCGWTEPKKGKRFSRHDADMIAFDANCDGEWTAWREEVKD